MPHRILTPNTHSEETLEIAHDLIPAGYELVTAPHGRPEFWNLAEYFLSPPKKRFEKVSGPFIASSAPFSSTLEAIKGPDTFSDVE